MNAKKDRWITACQIILGGMMINSNFVYSIPAAWAQSAAEYNDFGIKYFRSKQYGEAEGDFRKASDLSQGMGILRSQYMLNLERALEAQGKNEEAEATLQKSRRLLETNTAHYDPHKESSGEVHLTHTNVEAPLWGEFPEKLVAPPLVPLSSSPIGRLPTGLPPAQAGARLPGVQVNSQQNGSKRLPVKL